MMIWRNASEISDLSYAFSNNDSLQILDISHKN